MFWWWYTRGFGFKTATWRVNGECGGDDGCYGSYVRLGVSATSQRHSGGNGLHSNTAYATAEAINRARHTKLSYWKWDKQNFEPASGDAVLLWLYSSEWVVEAQLLYYIFMKRYHRSWLRLWLWRWKRRRHGTGNIIVICIYVIVHYILLVSMWDITETKSFSTNRL